MSTDPKPADQKPPPAAPGQPQTAQPQTASSVPASNTPTSSTLPSDTAHDPTEPKRWFDAATPGIEEWAQSSGALLTGLRDLTETTHLFTQSRLRANFDACNSLSSCHSLADVVRLQREYLENTATQYRQHAENMSKQASDIIAAISNHQTPKP